MVFMVDGLLYTNRHKWYVKSSNMIYSYKCKDKNCKPIINLVILTIFYILTC